MNFTCRAMHYDNEDDDRRESSLLRELNYIHSCTISFRFLLTQSLSEDSLRSQAMSW